MSDMGWVKDIPKAVVYNSSVDEFIDEFVIPVCGSAVVIMTIIVILIR